MSEPSPEWKKLMEGVEKLVSYMDSLRPERPCPKEEHVPERRRYFFFDQDLRDGSQTMRSEYRVVCKYCWKKLQEVR